MWLFFKKRKNFVSKCMLMHQLLTHRALVLQHTWTHSLFILLHETSVHFCKLLRIKASAKYCKGLILEPDQIWTLTHDWLMETFLFCFWLVLTILINAGWLFYINVVYFLRVSSYSCFRGLMSVWDCVWFPRGLGGSTGESRYFLISAVCHELFVTLSLAPKWWEMGLYQVIVMYYYETMMSYAQAISGIMLQSVWRVWQKVILLPLIRLKLAWVFKLFVAMWTVLMM